MRENGRPADIQALGAEFWAWRAATGFHSGDDIPRLTRPVDWSPSVAPAAIEARRRALAGFADRWSAIGPDGIEVADAVDLRLLGSALARAHWELDVVRSWERDAVFLASQIVGPYYDRLLPPPPFDGDRPAALVAAVAAMPARAAEARANLERAGVAGLARVAIELLDGIGDRIAASVAAVAPLLPAAEAAAIRAAQPAASAAADAFRSFLVDAVDGFAPDAPVGRERFVWYLRHVALIAADPEDLVPAAWQDVHRSIVGEAVARAVADATPEPAPPADAAGVAALEARRELEVRERYAARGLLTQPAGLRHYRFVPIPDYLAPLEDFGVSDHLPAALDAPAVSYIPEPRPDLPYFDAANARDPRLGIVHEGAHAQQLALAATNPRPIRRFVVDSVPNEGIAHYDEELLLAAGLFDDAPHSRVVMQNFIRLRALRVIVDVGLATGTLTLPDAVDLFVERVPMDRGTALGETAMYVATPGLAMSYHVGKRQLLALVADALRAGLPLQAVHDRVWLHGNVPFSLQRWELLGDRSEVDALDAAGSWRDD